MPLDDGKQRMISIDRALELVLEHARPLPPREIPLAESLGCVLAQDVPADRDHPPFDRAMMDGFAVRTADAGCRVRVAGEVAAGAAPGDPLEAGTAVRIMTGAPCPPGAEAVVPVEETLEEDGEVQLPPSLRAGRHIAARGCDRSAGERLLAAGDVVTAVGAAVLASVGAGRVKVIPRPEAAVISTGDELVDMSAEPGPHAIRDSNGPMLEVLARAAGFRVRASLRAGDNSEALEAALARADSADLVLLAGGVSAGKYDLVPRVVETAGVRPIFHKVRQKPGKPLLLGVRKDGGPGLFFGLPGNPLAVHACFHRYVLPAGRRMAGREPFRREGRARLAAPFRYKGDRHGFVPAVVRKGADGGWEAEVLVVSGSADIFTAARANALVSLPADGRERPAGEAVDFFWLGPEEEMITWTT